MPTPSFHTICTRNDAIAEGIHELEFEKPEGMSFEAGQFLLIDVPLIDDAEDIQPRAYSIASSPDDESIVLVIKLVPDGRASTWVKEKLQPGDEVRIQCPFGKFVLHLENPKEIVMMCTSTGIAPFRSQLRSALQHEDRKIDLFFGLLSEKELFWKDELDQLAANYPNFSYYVECSQPTDAWDGYTGYVQEHAQEVIGDFSNKQIYLCGSPLMTKAVKETAMNDWGVAKEDIDMEGFI